jgi:hypothetical protein
MMRIFNPPAICFLFLLAVAGTSSAATVTLDWVPLGGSASSGSLTLSSAQIINPNNFTISENSNAAVKADVTGFTYTWTGNTINSTQSFAVLAGTPAQILANKGSWTVTGGKLTSFFSITTASTVAGVAGAYGLFGGVPGLPSPANALSGSGTYNYLTGVATGTLAQGYWQVRPVPLPAAAVLLIPGLMGLAGFSRRRKSVVA